MAWTYAFGKVVVGGESHGVANAFTETASGEGLGFCISGHDFGEYYHLDIEGYVIYQMLNVLSNESLIVESGHKKE